MTFESSLNSIALITNFRAYLTSALKVKSVLFIKVFILFSNVQVLRQYYCKKGCEIPTHENTFDEVF